MTDISTTPEQANTPEPATPSTVVLENPTTSPTVDVSSAVGQSSVDTTESNSTVDQPAHSHLRTLITDALSEIGKLEHFTEEELERFWTAIQAKL